MTVTNTGDVAGDDVVQLYLHDPVASISQPVRRLRGFERVTLQPGESRKVTFTLDRSDFGFYDNRGEFVVEPGQIEVYAGDSSQATMKSTFTVTGVADRAPDTGSGPAGQSSRRSVTCPAASLTRFLHVRLRRAVASGTVRGAALRWL